ncbi:MAG: hypothetical protein N3G21_10225 [Candidatus Hydrogenedentes bacterium]|nr:hypothetical protein [Candidatus Hydrogenedentota bacterium]
MWIRFGYYLLLVMVVMHLNSSCNAYFERREKAQNDFSKDEEELPLRILPKSNIPEPNKEKDIGDIEDDLIVMLDISEPATSPQMNVLREEGRHGQIGRMEIEIKPPYPEELIGELTIKSLGKVSYLKYPVLVCGKVVSDKGEKLLEFEKYLPWVFGNTPELDLKEENSPKIRFEILKGGKSLQPCSFLLHAEVRVKLLNLKPEVSVSNPGDFSNIEVKDETILMSNPLRITLK